MTITQALRAMQQPKDGAEPFELLLVCGFTPLHLKTLMGGHLQLRLPSRTVRIVTGIYGDLPGTLESCGTKFAARKGPETAALILEWSDLDPRLGFREGGRWSPSSLPDIVDTVNASLRRLTTAVEAFPPGFRLIASLPGLPLPPLFHPVGWQTSQAEARLDQAVAGFSSWLAARPGIAVVNARKLGEQSPHAARYDLKSDLLTGLPYTLAHADALASAIALLAAPTAPRKGLISDLDDTFWYGLVGEIGPEAVRWDLPGHRYLHALYQKLLSSLSEEGVLVGIASKNDAAVVEAALQRSDLYVGRDRLFPVEAHWDAKSGSVARILKTWNISADSVVFVDDNPMELAEVAAEHPGIECVQFPRDDYAEGHRMLRKLRDLFGKDRLSAEDSIRLDSIRSGSEFRVATETGSASETFLQLVNATVEFDFNPSPNDARLLELVNKTNQFNLNGIRYTEAEWRRALSEPHAFLAAVSYADKFGPLGKIGVILGTRKPGAVCVSAWVLSCRAFSRRIEHQCLQTLFDRYAVGSLTFNFAPTARNGPLQEFLESVAGSRKEGPFSLSHEQFTSNRPPLYHKTGILEHSTVNG